MRPGAAQGARAPLRVWADLARAGNFPSVASNVLAALVLSMTAGRSWPDLGVLGWSLLAGLLAYAGGATLNDVADARFDARHRPERPLPRAALSRGAAGVLGVVQLGAGAGILLVLGADWRPVALLLVTIGLYDWLHKRWAGSVWLMGACRGFLALSLATLPGQAWRPALLIWVGTLILYIVGLSIVARREYQPGAPAARIGRRVGQLLACIPLIDAGALVAIGAWPAGLACAAAYPLGRLAQRLAAST